MSGFAPRVSCPPHDRRLLQSESRGVIDVTDVIHSDGMMERGYFLSGERRQSLSEIEIETLSVLSKIETQPGIGWRLVRMGVMVQESVSAR
jgi:hypothetical protein